MSQYKKEMLDEYIREAFAEKMTENLPPLTSTEAWERLQKTKKSKPRKHFGKSLLVVAALMLLLVVVWSPEKGTAFGRFVSMYHVVQGSVVQLVGQIGIEAPPKTKDTPKSADSKQGSEEEYQIIGGSEQIIEQVSLEEAQNLSDFSVEIPEFIPKGFDLDEVTIIRNDKGQVEEVFIHYNKGEQGFILSEMKVKDTFGFGAIIEQEGINVEEMLINGDRANLVEFDDDVRQLIWMTQTHYFSIEGNISEKQVIEIAKSM